jgi:transposase
MFKSKNNRYITRGVNKEVDIRLQLLMWSMIDNLNEKGNIEVDYLQVFKLKEGGAFIVIEHYQEVPEYKKVYSLELDDIELNNKMKIYVIDSGEYATMLLPEEY